MGSGFICKAAVFFGLTVALWAAAPAKAAPEGEAPLLERIFSLHEFATDSMHSARWIDGGEAYTVVEPHPALSGAGEIVRYESATGTRKVLVAATDLKPAPDLPPLTIDNYDWSTDDRYLLIYTNSQRVWRQKTRGDYWVLDLTSKKLHKLGGDVPAESLMFAKFSPDNRHVAYVLEHDLYVEDVTAPGAIRKLTTDGSTTIINGTSDWVNEEELDIRDGYQWSPDGRSIAYWQFDTAGVGVFTLIDDTVANYPVLKQFPYPHVGTQNSATRIGVVALDGGPTQWMQIEGDPREHYIPRITWTPDSHALLLESLNRLQNRNQILLADAARGSVQKVWEDEDEAWVDFTKMLMWADEGRSIISISERDGWRHAYKIALSSGEAKLLTPGDYDLMDEGTVDDSHGWFYFAASPKNATQRYLYRVSLQGGKEPQRMTEEGQLGTHFYSFAPNRKWAFHTYSDFDHPPQTELVEMPEGKHGRMLVTNERVAKLAAKIIPAPTELVHVTVGNGAVVDGWMIRPMHFDAAKKYPVLVYVYGEPAATTVNDVWTGERGLFHRAIADDGYIVVSFDTQGTPAAKGRAWRKMIYGTVGVLSSAQQAEAIQAFAASRAYVDTSRMAVWGWSGGGSNTLNLMFRSPGLFTAGMAVAPMADQHYYDTIYQERYMGLPQSNPQGYHDGSPINFAQGLKGSLLIVHGSGDDNCHIKVTELLMNRLIGLGKPFDFMEYPNRTHAISEGDGTSFHLYSLLSHYLESHVLPGGIPR